MTVWVIRAGGNGEFEDFFLEEGIAIIGFSFPRDLADFAGMDDLRERLSRLPEHSGGTDRQIASASSSLWRFYDEIQKGDIVLLAGKNPQTVSVGRISGEYSFRPEMVDWIQSTMYHTRTVEWIAQHIPRDIFDSDLMSAISRLTISKVNRRNADERIKRAVNAYLWRNYD